jgi:hypothetical protein
MPLTKVATLPLSLELLPTLPCMYQYISSHTLNLCLLYYYACTYST